MLSLVLLSATLLPGCDDVQNYLVKMHLNEEQTVKARPILEEHSKKQNQILESFKNQRPSGGPSAGSGGGMGGPRGGMGGFGGGMGGPGGSMEKPELSKMKEMMEKKKAELDEKFDENDNFAVRELEAFLSADQIGQFKAAAKEIREKKIKEAMSQRQNPRGGMGGPGGGMGRPGGGMGGHGGGMSGF